MSAVAETEIRSYIVKNFLFGVDDDNLKAEDSLLEKGVIDSTGVLEIISFVESTFGIAVEDDEMVPANLDSIDGIVRFVQRKRAAVPALVS